MIAVLANPKFWRGVSIVACIITVINAAIFPTMITICFAITSVAITSFGEMVWRTLDE